MKVIYKCEICGRTYSTIEECNKCESQGRSDSFNLPINVLTQNNFCGKDKMTFCVREYNYTYPHCYSSLNWATRDTYAGDNLDQFCGSGGLYSKDTPELNGHNKVEYFETPNFSRMVVHLISE